VAAFTEQILDLWTAGVDAIHLVYYADSKNLLAALGAIAELESKLTCHIPTMITFDLSHDGAILFRGATGSALGGIAGLQADRVGTGNVWSRKRNRASVT